MDELAQFPNLIRSRPTAKFNNPNPIDVHRPQSADRAFGDAILQAPAHEMNIVVNVVARFVEEILWHDSSILFTEAYLQCAD